MPKFRPERTKSYEHKAVRLQQKVSRLQAKSLVLLHYANLCFLDKALILGKIGKISRNKFKKYFHKAQRIELLMMGLKAFRLK